MLFIFFLLFPLFFCGHVGFVEHSPKERRYWLGATDEAVTPSVADAAPPSLPEALPPTHLSPVVPNFSSTQPRSVCLLKSYSANYTEPTPTVLVGVSGDTLRLLVRNNCSSPLSLHAHGVHTNKWSEGTLYHDDSVSQAQRGIVAPGEEAWLLWHTRCRGTCARSDEPQRAVASSSFWPVETSGSNDVSGFVWTSAERANADGTPIDVDQEVRLVLGRDAAGTPTVNGHLGGAAVVDGVVGQRVRLHVVASADAGAASLDGGGLRFRLPGEATVGSLTLLPGRPVTADVTLTQAGIFVLANAVGEALARRQVLTLRVATLADATPDVAVAPLLAEPVYPDAREREYFLRLEPVLWDYMAGAYDGDDVGIVTWNSESLDDVSPAACPGCASMVQSNVTVGTRFHKCRYVAYDDATFATPVAADATLGLVGPTLRAIDGDTLRITLRNDCACVGGFGLRGGRLLEVDGVPLADDSVRSGVELAPGDTVEVLYDTAEQVSGPASTEPAVAPSSRTFLYGMPPSSASAPRGTAAGLVGVAIIVRRGAEVSADEPRAADVAVDHVAVFSMVDEAGSPFISQNIAEFAPDADPSDPAFVRASTMPSVNGYAFGTGPSLDSPTHQRVRWHLAAVGGAVNVHAVSFLGGPLPFRPDTQTLETVVSLVPGVVASRDTVVQQPATAALRAEAGPGRELGLAVRVHYVAPSPSPSPSPSPPPPPVQHPVPDAVMTGHTRVYHLRVDVDEWDYAPLDEDVVAVGGPARNASRPWSSGQADRFGGSRSTLPKARFVAYTDDSFSTRTTRDQTEVQALGLLGPTLRAEVGDRLVVHLRNAADWPVSLHLPGLELLSTVGPTVPGSTTAFPRLEPAVPAGSDSTSTTYTWTVPATAGPAVLANGTSTFGSAAPSSAAHLYRSQGVSPWADVHAGLVGMLIVTAAGHATDASRGDLRPRDVDRELVTVLLTQAEASSPLAAGVDGLDSDVTITHTINGHVYGNGGLAFAARRHERVRWYVAAVGAAPGDTNALHWHGNLLSVRGQAVDTVALAAGDVAVADMIPDNVGIWLLRCLVGSHADDGMVARYLVEEEEVPSSLAANRPLAVDRRQSPLELGGSTTVAAARGRPLSGAGVTVHHPHWGAALRPFQHEWQNAATDNAALAAAAAVGSLGGSVSDAAAARDRVMQTRLSGSLEVSEYLFESLRSSSTSRTPGLSDFHAWYSVLVLMDLATPRPNSSDVTNINVAGAAETTVPYWHSARDASADDAGRPSNPDVHVNRATAWLDASFLYEAVGSMDNLTDCRIEVPHNVSSSAMYGVPAPVVVIAQLFADEHNRRCDEAAQTVPDSTVAERFAEARRRVVALYQKITVREWLAALVGEPLVPYAAAGSNTTDLARDTLGDGNVFDYLNPGIAQFDPETTPETSEAFAFACGPAIVLSALPSSVLSLTSTGQPAGASLLVNDDSDSDSDNGDSDNGDSGDEDGRTIVYTGGDGLSIAALTRAAFAVEQCSGVAGARNCLEAAGAAGIVRGLYALPAQETDLAIAPGLGAAYTSSGSRIGSAVLPVGADLLARTRELGLPPFHIMLSRMNLPNPFAGTNQTASDIGGADADGRSLLEEGVRTVLDALYPGPGSALAVDFVVGALVEPATPASSLGPALKTCLTRQLTRSRSADPHWFENGALTPDELADTYSTRLSHLVVKSHGDDAFPDARTLVARVTGTPASSADESEEADEGSSSSAEEVGMTGDSGEAARDADAVAQATALANQGLAPPLLPDNVFFVVDSLRAVPTVAFLFPAPSRSYDHVILLSPSYRLHWTAADGHIDFALQAATRGYMGIGFGAEPGTMKGADLVVTGVTDDGTVIVRDSFALDVGVPKLDTDVGGTSDVEVHGGSVTGPVTTVEFRRFVSADPEDPYDKPVAPGGTEMIYAFGQTLDFVYHGPSRSSAEVIDFWRTPEQAVRQDREVDDGLDVGQLVGFTLAIAVGSCLLAAIVLYLAVYRPRVERYERQMVNLEEDIDDSNLREVPEAWQPAASRRDLALSFHPGIVDFSYEDRVDGMSPAEEALVVATCGSITPGGGGADAPRSVRSMSGGRFGSKKNKPSNGPSVRTQSGQRVDLADAELPSAYAGESGSLSTAADNTPFKGGKLLPVDRVSEASFVVRNEDSSSQQVEIYLPERSPKFRMAVEPSSFKLAGGADQVVVVRLRPMCTTRLRTELFVGTEATQRFTNVVIRGESDLSTSIDFDEIRLLSRIGQGSFGVVFRAAWRGQDVAVKMLVQQEHNEVELKDFRREVALLGKLRHAAIIEFRGACLFPMRLSLMTEYARYGSLKAVYRRYSLPWNLSTKMIADCASGLSFLHESGIIHRDIKAANVLVMSMSANAEICVKLADFGSARNALYNPNGDKKASSAVGTPLYMAPELLQKSKATAEDMPREIRSQFVPRSNPSPASDVYSLGVLMYELGVEDEPFTECPFAWDVTEKVLAGDRPTLSDDVLQNAPAGYFELAASMWAQQPSDRPSTLAVMESLSVLLGDLGVRSAQHFAERMSTPSGSKGTSKTATLDADEEVAMLSATAWQGLEAEAEESSKNARSIPKARKGHARAKSKTYGASSDYDSDLSEAGSRSGSRKGSTIGGRIVNENLLAMQQVALHPDARYQPAVHKARDGGPQLRSSDRLSLPASRKVSHQASRKVSRAVRRGSVDGSSSSRSRKGSFGQAGPGDVFKSLSNNSETKRLDADQMDEEAMTALLMSDEFALGEPERGRSAVKSTSGSRSRSRSHSRGRNSSAYASAVGVLVGATAESAAAAAAATPSPAKTSGAGLSSTMKRRSSRRRKGNAAARQKAATSGGQPPVRPPDPGDRRLSLTKPRAPIAPV